MKLLLLTLAVFFFCSSCACESVEAGIITLPDSNVGIDDSIIVFNAGKDGNNTANLLTRVEKSVVQRQPDLVVMMIGTNDMFNMRNHLSMEQFKKNYQKLVKIIKKHSNLILMTIPPVYAPYIIKRKPVFHFEPNGPRLKEDSANSIVKQLAKKNHCTLLDLNRILRASGGANATKYSLFQNEYNFGINDGVHPTYFGTRVIAAAVYQTIKLLYPNAKRIVCFGDSITNGYRLRGAGTVKGHTYPAVLNRMLNP